MKWEKESGAKTKLCKHDTTCNPYPYGVFSQPAPHMEFNFF